MDLSIVIPYRDRAIALDRTLQSIRRESLEAEILVVDHGSRARASLHSIAQEYHAGVARLPHQAGPFNLSACRNAGAALSSGRSLIFQDVDVCYEPGSLEGLVEELDVHPWGIVLPELLFRQDDGTFTHPRERIFDSIVAGEHMESQEWIYAWMGLSAMRRAVFNVVGGFDQAFLGWGCEDMDFAYRASRVRIPFVFTRKCRGIHWPHPPQPEKDVTGRAAAEYFAQKHGFPLPCELFTPSGEAVDLRRSIDGAK